MDVGVSVSVGGGEVKVAVASGVGLAGGTKTVAVSVPGLAVTVSGNETGCVDAGLGPHAESVSKINKRIENTRFFISIVKASVLEIVIAL